MNRFKIKENQIEFWAYLAGLIEADGHIRLTKRQKYSITLAGHRGQYGHFYKIAVRVGMPFTIFLGKHSNTIKLVWTNPRAVLFILTRLVSFADYYRNNIQETNMFLKINSVLIPEKKSYYYKYLAAFSKLKLPHLNLKDLKEINNLIIISSIIGFIDGDGEMSIQISPSHYGKKKNIIDGTLKISQQNVVVLERIAAALGLLNINSESFQHCKIYTRTIVKESGVLRFNVDQLTVFTKLVDPSCFQNPWNFLGFWLIIIIITFKQCYEFSTIGRIGHKNNRSLVEWAKQRANLIMFLQLLRLFTRECKSKLISRLLNTLEESSSLITKSDIDLYSDNLYNESMLQKIRSAWLQVFPLLQSKKKKALVKQNLYTESISHIFVINEIFNPSSQRLSSPLPPLKHAVVCYIDKAWDILEQRIKFEHLIWGQIAADNSAVQSLNTTYYPLSSIKAKKAKANQGPVQGSVDTDINTRVVVKLHGRYYEKSRNVLI